MKFSLLSLKQMLPEQDEVSAAVGASGQTPKLLNPKVEFSDIAQDKPASFFFFLFFLFCRSFILFKSLFIFTVNVSVGILVCMVTLITVFCKRSFIIMNIIIIKGNQMCFARRTTTFF